MTHTKVAEGAAELGTVGHIPDIPCSRDEKT